MKRINLTQHKATDAQGCEPRSDGLIKWIQELLTFREIPDMGQIVRRAHALCDIAQNAGADEAMIGGAPYLILMLDPALRMRAIEPVYAFSKRESVEELQDDGSVRKVSIFRHVGFVRLGSGGTVSYSLDGANAQEKSARNLTEKE